MKGEIKSLPSAGSALSNAYLHLKDRCVFADTVVYVCLNYKQVRQTNNDDDDDDDWHCWWSQNPPLLQISWCDSDS